MSSRSSSPSLTVPSTNGLYIPVHRRGSSVSSSGTSHMASLSASDSFDSDSAILSPTTPTFIYSRDILLNLAKSPLSRMSQTERDRLRSEVPEVITNRKQRKTIEYFNHMNAVEATATLHAHSPRSSHSNDHDQRRRRDQ